ncbi:hypothetical protein B0H13DRAFT_190462 [Mycena leptocephala]|nr:hypothetical protein B0H13DRAFT_190462 [Mycena leptocephala]
MVSLTHCPYRCCGTSCSAMYKSPDHLRARRGLPPCPPQKHGWVHYPFQYRPLQMSDSDSTYPPQRSSLILFFATAALSLIPDDVLRYSSLGVVLTSLGIYAAHRKRPLARLDAPTTGSRPLQIFWPVRGPNACRTVPISTESIKICFGSNSPRPLSTRTCWKPRRPMEVVCSDAQGNLADTQPLRAAGTNNSDVGITHYRI